MSLIPINNANTRKSNGVVQSRVVPQITLSLPTRTGPDDKLWAAPCQVICSATDTTGTAVTYPFHELFYVWDFGDGSSGTWSYGAGTLQSKNVEYGPIGGHVYDNPGTYTITLTVSDFYGTVATTTQIITVNNPDTCYPGAQTICIGRGATANGSEPAGSTYVQVEDFANWLTNNVASNTRYLLRAGDSFTHGDNGATSSINSISWAGGVVTVGLAAPTTLSVGDSYYLTIAGVTPSGYKGLKYCTVVNSTTVTYAFASNPGAATLTSATITKAAIASGVSFTDKVNIYVGSYPINGTKPILDNKNTLFPQSFFIIRDTYLFVADNFKFINLKTTNSVGNAQNSFSQTGIENYYVELLDLKRGHILMYKLLINSGTGSIAGLGYGGGYVDCVVDNVIGGAGQGPCYVPHSPMTMICGNSFDGRGNGEHGFRTHAGSRSVYAHNKIVNPNTAKSCATLRTTGYGTTDKITYWPAAWAANTRYSCGKEVKASDGSGIFVAVAFSNGALNLSGTVEPNWSSISAGQTIVDNNITWYCVMKSADGPWCLESKYIVFRDNYLSSNYDILRGGDKTPLSIGPTGVVIFSKMHNYLVESNYIETSGTEVTRFSINLGWLIYSTFRNNIIVQQRRFGGTATVYPYGINISSDTVVDAITWFGPTWIYNNTFFVASGAGGGTSVTNFVNLNLKAQTIAYVKNNVFYCPDAAHGMACVYIDPTASALGSTAVCENNSMNNIITNSYFPNQPLPADPLFTNGSTTWQLASDFTTQVGSVARQAGQPVTNKYDFAMTVRSHPFDMGAFES